MGTTATAIVICLLAGPSRAFVAPSHKPPATGWVGAVGFHGDAPANRRLHNNLPAQTNGIEPIDSNPSRTDIVVHPLSIPAPKQPPQVTQDLFDLADLRYDEWIAIDDHHDHEPPPSKYAFRMATAEIAAERSEAGAVVLLARSSSSHGVAMGAAELSPIELRGALVAPSDGCWYVTDVLASARFRRMGVASALMDALEHHAWQHHSDRHAATLYLHVAPENDAALACYATLGYAAPSSSELRGLDTAKLEANANTFGQTLLCKTLRTPPPPPSSSTTQNLAENAAVGASTGFGTNHRPTTNKKKKKKKAKRRKTK